MVTILRRPALILIVAAACHSGAPGGTQPANQTRARIENRASLDVDISVRRNDGRLSRLGFVPGGETAVFALPPSVTAGAAWVRFEAKPVRSSGEPVVSEPFPVTMGEEITWSVPPQ
ncbi:MAG TPA: hypothetical protein VGR09_13675 [Gemmatimonadales bacterium]|nr:hypothetical protein [Gemmatimonadales bacterium]